MTDRPEASDNDIAVVGMALRVPGASTPDAFWENLRAGVESVQHWSVEELEEAGVDPKLLRDPRYVRAGGILDGIELFDAGFFGIGAKDAGIMDPQHRFFLECCWEALEDAGHTAAGFPGAIGVFAGCGMGSYFIHNILTNKELVDSVGVFLLRHTSNDKDFLSTFVSYKMDLTGPSVNVQTACSTSLVGIHAACQSLLNGECDMALAGGSTISVPHKTGYVYHEGEVLSPDGHCHAFDARSAGTVFGNGSGAVVLRRLQDALDDGDPIHAVIKGSAINNDGSQKAGYLAPSVDGQAHAIAEAISVAGVDADTITYVEAHGTGTAVGDPIEVAALTQAFGETTDATGFCGLGSVKPNIGHLDTAAGVASFIKVVMALKHRELPPSINFERPNPAIDFEHSPFFVNDALRPWEGRDGLRRAGVSSLGVGGTNAHAVLEEAPAREPGGPSRAVQQLLLSARTPSALDAASARLAAHLRAHPELDLADVAWTLKVGRKPFEHRRTVVCRSTEEAIERLEQPDPKHVFKGKPAAQTPSVAFMFPGGGAQHPGMAKGLYESEPVFREELDRCLAILRERCDLDLAPLLFPGDDALEEATERFEHPPVQLPAIFAVEYALARLWMSWGIEPAAMIGHSLGENTAACLAGVLSLEDALGLVVLRGRLVERTARGGMMSVALPADAVEGYLGDDLALASVNAPALCVVSGAAEAIDALEKQLADDEIEHHRVRISVAGHSSMLDPILGEFGAYLRSIELHPPEIPFVSNRTGTWITDEQATSPDYWVQHFRNTIHFADGVGTLLETPGRVLLEVGPGKMLGSLARQHPDAQPGQAILSSLRHPQEPVDDADFLHGVLGRLWNAGVLPDWERFYEGEARRRVSLPTYPFERQPYWIAPGRVTHEAAEASAPLERLEHLSDWFRHPVWRSTPAPAAPVGGTARWLVFLDAVGLGRELAERLRAAGHRVVTVREGDAFYRFSDDEYALAPEGGRAGYDALVKDLADRDALPDRVLHLWPVTAGETARAGSSSFHRNQETGFYSLLFLGQALGDEASGREVRFDVISTGMQRVADEPLPHPDKATLLGPVRVMPHELPEFRCRSIDVVLPALAQSRLGGAKEGPLARLVERLLRELADDATGEIVAWRDDTRFEQGLEPLALDEAKPEATPLRERGCYLVTGGLGGIGLAVAEHLAHQVQARLVLVGRSGLPAPEAWDAWLERHGEGDWTSQRIRKLRALEAEGAEVLVAAGDVANIESMRAVVGQARERFGPIHGVFHTAGTMEDGVIQMKTPEAVERVFTPKVHGTLVLAELFADPAPDFLALFSSTSTWVGPPGQVDYTAANVFLDAFAESRRGAPGRTIAIDWGVWNEVGMARRLSSELRGDDRGAAREHTLVDHPWLDECIESGAARFVFAGRLAADACWMLDEHRFRDGRAVVPGTGHLELARAAFAAATGAEAVALGDVSFVAPLEVGDREPRDLEVVLERDGAGFRFEVRSRPAGAGGRWQVHAQGRAEADAGPPPGDVDPAALAEACRGALAEGTGLATDQDAFLAFGPRWRSLARLGFGEGEAFARLALPEAFADDVPTLALHPALLDLATGCALRLIEGYEAGKQLYVPLGYGRVRCLGPLPARLVSHVRGRGRADAETARFDVTLADEAGRVRVEIEGFTVRRLAGPPVAAPAAAVEEPAHVSAAERVFLESFEAGIRVEEGMAALDRVLASPGHARVVVSSLDLERLIERNAEAQAAAEEGAGVKFARPSLQSEYEAPRDEIEKTLVTFWEELLGVDPIGIHDDFFELGGHSLIAVRLFAQIKKRYDVEYPLSILFDAPTVAGCAELLREEIGEAAEEGAPKRRRREHDFLVPMNAVGETEKAPFFLVSGMFGNVLNLRHLAAHLGDDQPVYAIQAKGLYGEEAPHDRFEDMARDYLKEIRSVQPEGPYFLGGFSGGGITAFEMARQLQAAGEEVATVVLLDSLPSRVPGLTRGDRLKIQWQRLRRQGVGYVYTWARNRARWELERIRKLFYEPVVEVTPAEFRSEQIEIAFREALDHYEMRPLGGDVHLYRPALDASHDLGGGRVAGSHRRLVDPRNFWGPWVEGTIHVEEVPGDHDAMVLEPYVRVLGAKMKLCIEDAQRRVRSR